MHYTPAGVPMRAAGYARRLSDTSRKVLLRDLCLFLLSSPCFLRALRASVVKTGEDHATSPLL